MGSDSYFRMGSTHAICQDYALSGTREGIDFAIVADGCSGVAVDGIPGSPFTDFGARFLALSAMRWLSTLAGGGFPALALITDAAAKARASDLPKEALDATLITAVRNGNVVHVRQTGDGVVVAKKRNGKLQYTSLKFGNNAPYYLSYLLSEGRRQSLLSPEHAAPENKAEAGLLTLTEGTFSEECWKTNSIPTQLTYSDDLGVTNVCRSFEFDASDTEFVLILSDGAESFQLKDGTPVPLEQVLEQICAIKGLAGEFIVRRCNRFLQSFCVERGWKHYDDLSVAGIVFP